MAQNNATISQDDLQQELREAKIVMSRKQWERFDNFMKENGCQTFAEGLRAAIREITSGRAKCQLQNGSTQ